MYGPGTVLADRYRLEARVGTGGMGEVWRSTDQVLDRTVAVKTMHPALLEEATFARRFRSEARAMATIEHPGVVAVYDYRTDEAGAFLVMAYVDGEPLSRLLRQTGNLPASRVLELVAQAAEALHAAHEQGIVHRDVKPANLLLRRSGALVLTDFGIARTQSGTQLTATGAVPGTLSYLAPEQLLGHPASPLSDVYALGVVAYQALVGQLPFVRDNAFAGALARVQEPPPALPAGIPAPVAGIVCRALAADPALRWPSAAALAAACRQAAAGSDPTPAAPASPAATTTGSVHRAPTVPAHDPPGTALPPTRRAPRGRWLAVGVLGLASAVLYIVLMLVAGSIDGAWVDSLAPVGMALVAAILLLATGKPAWAGLLAGVLAWEWRDFTYWTVDHRLPDRSWVWTWQETAWFGANLMSLLTVLLAAFWLVRSRDGRSAQRPPYSVVVTTVAGLFAVTTTMLAARSLPSDYLSYLSQAAFPDALLIPLVMVVIVGCVAVLPVVLLAAPRSPAAQLTAVGWFLGGVQFAVTQAFGWLSDSFWESTPLGGMFWFLLLATVATALTATVLPAGPVRSPGSGAP